MNSKKIVIEEKVDAFTKGPLISPSGIHDILPDDQDYWQRVRSVCEKETRLYGYRRIDTPILENAKLFEKGTGQVTDIVEKEMYTVTTKGGESLAMRPEFTPGIMRAFLEHGMANLPRPVKLWTLGPLFRHDRPQRGRYRQFHQFDLECLNSESAVCDVEAILVTFRILKKIGLKGFVFHISSIGDANCRPVYEKQLIVHLRASRTKLCADCKKRLDKRPLRVFDCKEEKCQRVARVAPKMLDNLCEACHSHFKDTLEMLDELEIPYQLDSNIVRGLDYYTRTVFEVIAGEQENSQDEVVLGGGGRYDGLAEVLGGRPTPAVGVALGVERLINLMKAQNIVIKKTQVSPPVFLAQLGFLAKKKALKLMASLQAGGVLVAASFDRNSLKSQLKAADRMGARIAVIIGQKEVLEETAIIRNMLDGTQETIAFKKIEKVLQKRLDQLPKQ